MDRTGIRSSRRRTQLAPPDRASVRIGRRGRAARVRVRSPSRSAPPDPRGVALRGGAGGWPRVPRRAIRRASRSMAMTPPSAARAARAGSWPPIGTRWGPSARDRAAVTPTVPMPGWATIPARIGPTMHDSPQRGGRLRGTVAQSLAAKTIPGVRSADRRLLNFPDGNRRRASLGMARSSGWPHAWVGPVRRRAGAGVHVLLQAGQKSRPLVGSGHCGAL